MAASTNSLVRYSAVFTPIDSAMICPPLSERMARPSRESSRLRSSHNEISVTTQITTPMERGDSSDRPPSRITGMLVMPVWPPRNSMLPNR